MPASVSLHGGAELRYVAGKLRKAAARDLTRELRAGQRKAFRPLQPEIKAEAALSLPKRGGYAGIMSRAVKVSVRTGFGPNALTARIYARGRAEARDVVAVNDGLLRHPRFGDRQHWYAQRVRRGFVDRPVDRVADRVLGESAEAAERVLQQIART